MMPLLPQETLLEYSQRRLKWQRFVSFKSVDVTEQLAAPIPCLTLKIKASDSSKIYVPDMWSQP